MQMTECEAELFIETNRRLYDAGMRLADPDDKLGGRQFLRTNRQEGQYNILRTLRKRRRA
jgi:hypothetical protein